LKGFESNARSLAGGTLYALALLLPLLGILEGSWHSPTAVTVTALLYPAILYPPITPVSLLGPGRQDLLCIEVRLALVLERPFRHGQHFLDRLT
jgi:hypothetical protein